MDQRQELTSFGSFWTDYVDQLQVSGCMILCTTVVAPQNHLRVLFGALGG